MLVDGRGVPLSLVVTGANRHDVSQREAVLDAIVVERPNPPMRRHKHLCADAGYTGAPALKVIEEHGYIPHVKGRGGKRQANSNVTPGKKGQTLDCRGGTQLVQSIQNALGAVRET